MLLIKCHSRISSSHSLGYELIWIVSYIFHYDPPSKQQQFGIGELPWIAIISSHELGRHKINISSWNISVKPGLLNMSGHGVRSRLILVNCLLSLLLNKGSPWRMNRNQWVNGWNHAFQRTKTDHKSTETWKIKSWQIQTSSVYL